MRMVADSKVGTNAKLEILRESRKLEVNVPITRQRATTRRADMRDTDLCRGPGNLTRALAITLRQNGSDLTASALRIEDRGGPARQVSWTRRIGINVGVEQEWRVFATGSAAVSGRNLASSNSRQR
jgi:DNA-3-methyladenine glycosylase